MLFYHDMSFWLGWCLFLIEPLCEYFPRSKEKQPACWLCSWLSWRKSCNPVHSTTKPVSPSQFLFAWHFIIKMELYGSNNSFFFTCRKDNFTFKCHRSNGTGNANYQDIYAVSLNYEYLSKLSDKRKVCAPFDWIVQWQNSIIWMDVTQEICSLVTFSHCCTHNLVVDSFFFNKINVFAEGVR